MPPAEPAGVADTSLLGRPDLPTGTWAVRGKEIDSKERQQMKSKLTLHKFLSDFYKDTTL